MAKYLSQFTSAAYDPICCILLVRSRCAGWEIQYSFAPFSWARSYFHILRDGWTCRTTPTVGEKHRRRSSDSF